MSSQSAKRCGSANLLFAGLVFFALFACASCLQSGANGENDAIPPQPGPNFVVILADDLRADFLGYAGHPIVETPNIDRLAKIGVVFHNAFATSPICTPSRTSLFTGQYERKHGVNFQSQSVLPEAAFSQSYPGLLRTAGYHVAYIGKNHTPMGSSAAGSGYRSGLLESAFDTWFGNHRHMGFYPKNQHNIYEPATADTQIEILGEGSEAYLTPAQSGSPIETLLGSRPNDQPFAILINLNVPHSAGTRTMRQRETDDALYKTAYRDRIDAFALPETYLAADEIKTPKIPRYVYSGEYISSYDYVKTPDDLREQLVRTAQTVTGIDRLVGNLVANLEATGELDNTFIIFTSDHGIQLGEHGLGGKALLYEESVRIPMLIAAPKRYRLGEGNSIDELVALIDIAPTILDYAGIDIPTAMHGESMRSLINGTDDAWREEIFLENLYVGQNYPRIEAMRSERYKYIRYFDKAREESYASSLRASHQGEAPVYEEFYDLEIDPLEQTNLITSADYAELIEAYRSKHNALLAAALK